MTPEGNRQPAGGANLPAAQPKPALPATGGQVMAIIPKTVEEMFRLADAISKSGLAPNTLNNSQKVMVAIMAGAELGMPPWQATQSFAVIGNRATIWGDAIPALLWSKGFKIKEWFEGNPYDDNYTAHCVVTRPDGSEIPGEFSVLDAKEAGLWTKSGPWQTAKKRMLKMRARAFAARDGAADVLRGMQVQEEVADYVVDVTPTRGEGGIPSRRAEMLERMRANQHQAADTGFDAGHVASELGAQEEVPHNPETGEVIEDEAVQDAEFEEAGSHLSGDPVDDLPDAGPKEPEQEQAPATEERPQEPATEAEPVSLETKIKAYEQRLRAATTTTKLTSIRNANAKLRQEVEREAPERWEQLDQLFNELWTKLGGGE